jgi:hypothetical protein
MRAASPSAGPGRSHRGTARKDQRRSSRSALA